MQKLIEVTSHCYEQITANIMASQNKQLGVIKVLL